MRMTKEQFYESIIAQDDDCDYSESGYVAGVFQDVAYIARYSHCSCYCTFSVIGDDVANFDWRGSVDELIEMAKRKADPAIPERTADPEDYDYDHLISVYRDILSHFGVVN